MYYLLETPVVSTPILNNETSWLNQWNYKLDTHIVISNCFINMHMFYVGLRSGSLVSS